MKKERASNIELLRIVAIMGVVLLHYNRSGALSQVADGSLNQAILYFLDSLAMCAVNLFILITGYFMVHSNTRSLWKPIQLIVQVMCFSLGFYILKIIMGNTVFSWKSLIVSLIPNKYFIIFYVVIYLISPYLNMLIKKLNDDDRKRMMIIFLLIFSVYPTLVDLLSDITRTDIIGLSSITREGSLRGFTIVQFMLMYLIGAYLRMQEEKRISNEKLLLSLFAIALLLTGWSFIFNAWGMSRSTACSYCNPLIIAEAVILFLLFKQMPLKNNLIINRLSGAGITIYLINNYLLLYANADKVAHFNTPMMFGAVIVTAGIIYFIGWLVHEIWNFIATPVFRFLEKKILWNKAPL